MEKKFPVNFKFFYRKPIAISNISRKELDKELARGYESAISEKNI